MFKLIPKFYVQKSDKNIIINNDLFVDISFKQYQQIRVPD